MPVYEYECETCSCRFDLRQSFSDSPVTSCPRCQGSARRVFVPVPIIFKGSGFYVTDHRNDGNGKGNGPKDDSTAATKEAPEKTKTEVVSKAKD
jgi:putative FmdB family regulatory protein